MSLGVKGVVDRRMGGEETLGRGLAFEELLLPLPPSDRKMGVLRPIVLPEPTRSMKMAQLELIQRRNRRPSPSVVMSCGSTG